MEVFKYDPTVTREIISKMIIMHEDPFSCVEHKWFIKALSSLNLRWNSVYRNTIKNDVMMIYELEKTKIFSLF